MNTHAHFLNDPYCTIRYKQESQLLGLFVFIEHATQIQNIVTTTVLQGINQFNIHQHSVYNQNNPYFTEGQQLNGYLRNYVD